MIGHWEVVLIFLVVLLLFGARKIPEIAQGLGKGIREFRKATKDVKDEIDEAIEEEDEGEKKELQG